MRKFKSTPQKKFLGMVILFAGIPLFLLLYALFITDWRPSTDTTVIVVALAAIFYYFYRKYKKQPAKPREIEEPAEQPDEEIPAESEAAEPEEEQTK